jgi:hypothetical protein
LRDHFKFDVGGDPTATSVIGPNSIEFSRVEGHSARPVECFKIGIRTNRKVNRLVCVNGFSGRPSRRERIFGEHAFVGSVDSLGRTLSEDRFNKTVHDPVLDYRVDHQATNKCLAQTVWDFAP